MGDCHQRDSRSWLLVPARFAVRVAVMRRMRAALAWLALGAAVLLAGCGGGMLSPDVVVVNGRVPGNPPSPHGTHDTVGPGVTAPPVRGRRSFYAHRPTFPGG